MENIVRSPGVENSVESCHVSGCHVFFGPEFFIRKGKMANGHENPGMGGGLRGAERGILEKLVRLSALT